MGRLLVSRLRLLRCRHGASETKEPGKIILAGEATALTTFRKIDRERESVGCGESAGGGSDDWCQRWISAQVTGRLAREARRPALGILVKSGAKLHPQKGKRQHDSYRKNDPKDAKQ